MLQKKCSESCWRARGVARRAERRRRKALDGPGRSRAARAARTIVGASTVGRKARAAAGVSELLLRNVPHPSGCRDSPRRRAVCTGRSCVLKEKEAARSAEGDNVAPTGGDIIAPAESFCHPYRT